MMSILQLAMERLYLQGRVDEAAAMALRLVPYEAPRLRPGRKQEDKPFYAEPDPTQVQPLSAVEEQQFAEIVRKYNKALAECRNLSR
jgi:hypothetical protein